MILGPVIDISPIIGIFYLLSTHNYVVLYT